MPIKRAMGAVQLVVKDYEAILRMSIFTMWPVRLWLSVSAMTGSLFLGMWFSHTIDSWSYHYVVLPWYVFFGSIVLVSLLDWMKPPAAPVGPARAYGMGFLAGFITLGLATLGTGYFLLMYGEQIDHYMFKQIGAWVLFGGLAFVFFTYAFAETPQGVHWVKMYQGWAQLSQSESSANNAQPTAATQVNDARVTITRPNVS